jgi:hypothetical protein
MAVVSLNGLFTYAEWSQRFSSDGKLAVMVNLASQSNAILEDQLATPCQAGNTFEFVQVVSLPSGSRRVYNQGVAPSAAAATKQVTTCSEYGDWAVVDSSLANLGGSAAQLRYDEVALHMEGMSQTVAGDLFYASPTGNVTEFIGLANIYNTVSTSTSKIANNVIDGGGTGSSNASMWLLGWGSRHIHTTFPQGHPTGLQHRDFGEGWKSDTTANTYEFPAFRDWLQWNIGVAVHDWRYGVRVPNIDVSLLFGSNGANIINILSQMVYKPPVMPAGVAPVQTSDDPARVTQARSAIYLNRTVYLALDQQAQNKTNVLLKMEEWGGHAILTYRGIPLQVVDQLTTTEVRVV